MNNVMLINTSEIIKVVRKTLGKIDSRLVDHGDRVGYIALKMLAHCPDKNSFEREKLFILCSLHDIGAYKTNEIDDMIKFETEAVLDHSLYGYIFLKNTVHLSECAEAVLYHHSNYTDPMLRESKYANYAEIIHLADRADILISTHGNLKAISALSGTKFNPVYCDALFAAENEGLTEDIRSGAFMRKVNEFIDTISVPQEQILEYLKLLVYAIDFRSPETVTHTADTTLASMEAGRRLGLGKEELQPLYIGAFLHDIGKIAIPHKILEKPGKLTADEYEIVKTHIPEGEEILRGVVSDEICNIALRHHEKLDGTGYSTGLTADELTMPERIVAVADIFSALTQRRSYKAPFPKEKTLGILYDMKDSGKLCSRVVDIFCDNYDSILYNIEVSHDPVKALYNNLISDFVNKREKMLNAFDKLDEGSRLQDK